MGEVAGAGLLAHVPTIMLPYEQRLELNEGQEISLVPGLERLRVVIASIKSIEFMNAIDNVYH